MTPWPLVTDLADLVWPSRCGGCAARGPRWCPACADDLAGAAFPVTGTSVRPVPAPPGMPPAHAWGPYRGAVRTVVVAYKDRERRDLARVLAPLLARSMAAALTEDDAAPHGSRGGPLLVVPVPSSAASVRRRGDAPMDGLGRAALRLLLAGGSHGRPSSPVPRWAPCLVPVRPVGDQAGLDRAARAANLSGAFVVRPSWRRVVPGARCLVVDDVMTTGATLTEAARALRSAGAVSVTAATVAATARRDSRETVVPARGRRGGGAGAAAG